MRIEIRARGLRVSLSCQSLSAGLEFPLRSGGDRPGQTHNHHRRRRRRHSPPAAPGSSPGGGE